MNEKISRILYFLLFYLGWIGIIWTAYSFCINAYNESTNVFAENPSYFILLLASLMSIATAYILEQTGQAKQ